MVELKQNFCINDQTIGFGQPTYVIAELSPDDLVDFERAVEVVHLAHQSGANAIKLPSTAATAHAQLPELNKVALQLGLAVITSPMDQTELKRLESIGIFAYGVADRQFADDGLIRKIAATSKPMIVSTGSATIDEIENLVSTIRQHGCGKIALLKGTPQISDQAMNLRTIADLNFRFQIPVGLSDATLVHQPATIAIALGASVIEKPLAIARSAVSNPIQAWPTPNAALAPDEFAEWVAAIRVSETLLGSVHYGPVSALPIERRHVA